MRVPADSPEGSIRILLQTPRAIGVSRARTWIAYSEVFCWLQECFDNRKIIITQALPFCRKCLEPRYAFKRLP
jgi:hypothetical protein